MPSHTLDLIWTPTALPTGIELLLLWGMLGELLFCREQATP